MIKKKSASSTKVPRARINLTNSHSRIKPDLAKLKRTLYRLEELSPSAPLRIDIVFTDDKQISELAGEFRNSEGPTDVLAFTYGMQDDSERYADFPYGEVVVSIDTAKRQARERALSLQNELALLCLHGILHVYGQDDETYGSWCEMRVREFEKLMGIL